MDLEVTLGSDMLDQIWQIPYERLGEKLKLRYDAFAEKVVNSIGTDKPLQVLVLDSHLPPDSIMELEKAWRWMEAFNSGKIGADDELEEYRLGDLEEKMNQVQLLAECNVAFSQLKTKGVEFTGPLAETWDKLQKYMLPE